MSYRNYVHTIQDLEKLYYSQQGAQYIAKADAPTLSTTTGVYNAVYGAQVWYQINTEANVLGAVPKYVWGRSGWRVITARAASSGGGVAENAALPETIKSTKAEVSTKPKTVAHNFDVSEVQDFLANESEDDAYGGMEDLRVEMGVHHKEMMNVMLTTDFDTLASNNLESIDRVAASDNEETSLSYTAGDADIYGIDRSASSWSDAYVSHASGTDRDLSDALIRDVRTNTGARGAKSNVWMTGWDTESAITGQYDGQVRYNPLGERTFKIGVNGIETKEGIGVGITIATLYNLPLIISKDVVKDTISRVYLLDTTDTEGYGVPRLGLKIAKPTQYFEAGMRNNDPFGINKLGTEGMYRTMGELVCTFLAAQGKIRDLQ